MDLCTSEHPQSNGMVEKMMGNSVKVTHAVVTEVKNPAELLQSFLREYRATPDISTGIVPSVLIFGRPLKIRLPAPPNLLQKGLQTLRLERETRSKSLNTSSIQIRDAEPKL